MPRRPSAATGLRWPAESRVIKLAAGGNRIAVPGQRETSPDTVRLMDLDILAPLLSSCPYPSGIVCIDRGITGNGYYPGARGFPEGSDPRGGIMLLGRDFGLHSYYLRRSRIANADETMLTWQQTVDCALKPLDGVGVWALNYLLGARLSGPATGDLRDSISPEQWQAYEGFCWHFLCRAALLQRPGCIVVYGANNARDLQRVGRLEGPRHTFRDAAGQHTAEIRYKSHPSSLRSRVRQERARGWHRELAISIRTGSGALRA